jgi:hypothetical protein
VNIQGKGFSLFTSIEFVFGVYDCDEVNGDESYPFLYMHLHFDQLTGRFISLSNPGT